jgi:hypothetical protein
MPAFHAAQNTPLHRAGPALTLQRSERSGEEKTALRKTCVMKCPFFFCGGLTLATLLLLSVGCVSKRSEMGVENTWRDPSPPAFQKGQTTEADVMRALGPPSQVIALQDQTLFYYLREQSRSKAVYLVVYNQTRQQIDYDRAIFFFDKQRTLTDFAYSKEAVPKK